ncbi:MAG: major facilitator superfamily domain-containing protein [Monoraphidium minutum]|nr:MAG: major facilitator superfamily domain-containing protein [Monoraphidium minutum]
MAHLRTNSATARHQPRPLPLSLEAGAPPGAPPARAASARSLGGAPSSGGSSERGSSRGGSRSGSSDVALFFLESGGGGGGLPPPTLEAAYRKVHRRLVPLLMLILGLNYLDRTSVAFAAVQMTRELGFGPAVFGVGAGLFFISYCAMQVPANLVCVRIGVTRWFTTIMLCWGAAAAAFAAVRAPWQFFGLRLLLGAAEAGSFPGAWHALSLWLPPDRIAYPFALLGTAVAVSQVLAAPLSAALLSLDGLWGLRGWQWVFLGEAAPSVCLGLALPWILPDSPHRGARGLGMLTPEELELVKADHAAKLYGAAPALPQEELLPPAAAAGAPPEWPRRPTTLQLLARVARIWQLWVLALSNILKDMANMALMAWLPVMVEALLSGDDPTRIAAAKRGSSTAAEGGAAAGGTGAAAVLLSAIPFSCAAVASTAIGARMQRLGRPLRHAAALNLGGGASLFAFHWVVRASRPLGFACLAATLSCAYAAAPAGPILVAQLAAAGPGGGPGGGAAALALPLYNSAAMFGGFLGPAALGALAQRLGGDFGLATAALGGCMAAAGLLAAGLERAMLADPRTRHMVDAKAGGKDAAGTGGGGGGSGVYDSVPTKDGGGRPRAGTP